MTGEMISRNIKKVLKVLAKGLSKKDIAEQIKGVNVFTLLKQNEGEKNEKWQINSCW